MPPPPPPPLLLIAAVTLTTTDFALDVPPAPLQARVNVLVAVSAPVLSLPDAALFPAQAPDAAQPVALVDDHVSIADWPDAIVIGLAVSVAVGADTCVTEIGAGHGLTGVIVGTFEVADVVVMVTSAASVAPTLSVTTRWTVIDPTAGAGTLASAWFALLMTAVPDVTVH
jgi:hypothetical protein